MYIIHLILFRSIWFQFQWLKFLVPEHILIIISSQIEFCDFIDYKNNHMKNRHLEKKWGRLCQSMLYCCFKHWNSTYSGLNFPKLHSGFWEFFSGKNTILTSPLWPTKGIGEYEENKNRSASKSLDTASGYWLWLYRQNTFPSAIYLNVQVQHIPISTFLNSIVRKVACIM